MTVWKVLRTLLKRRWITLATLLGTTAALMVVAAHPGVYWAQANVVFLAPNSTLNPNALQSTSAGLIATAGLVERSLNADVSKPATAAEVTLIGQGVRDGYSIELPDVGGQWAHNFDRAMLNIQVTGPNARDVGIRLTKLIETVRATTREMQSGKNIASTDLIRISVAPTDPQVNYSTGSPLRALLVSGLLGLALSVFIVVMLDRLLLRRARASTAIGLREGALMLP